MPVNGDFSSSEFDAWADTYDQSISADQFPFTGYERLLDKVVTMAKVKPGMSVLDLGSGTGNLAFRFFQLECNLCCCDFSFPMLQKARKKIPGVGFFQCDLRFPVPLQLSGSFDRIVSAYVFHHFDLDEKIRILHRLLFKMSKSSCIVIGDISFQNQSALEIAKADVGNEWEQEFYWIADETLAAMQIAGMRVEYLQVSSCAGVYIITYPDS